MDSLILSNGMLRDLRSSSVSLHRLRLRLPPLLRRLQLLSNLGLPSMRLRLSSRRLRLAPLLPPPLGQH